MAESVQFLGANVALARYARHQALNRAMATATALLVGAHGNGNRITPWGTIPSMLCSDARQCAATTGTTNGATRVATDGQVGCGSTILWMLASPVGDDGNGKVIQFASANVVAERRLRTTMDTGLPVIDPALGTGLKTSGTWQEYADMMMRSDSSGKCP